MNNDSSNIFVSLSSIPRDQMAFYLLLFLAVMCVSKISTLSTNTFCFMIVAIGLICVMYQRDLIKNETNTPSLSVRPSVATQPDIIQFLSETNNYYYANDVVYKTFVSDLDNFMRIYNQFIRTDLIYPIENAEIAFEHARNAQNNFNSLIYSLEPSNCQTHQFHLDQSRLNSLLNKYIKRILTICSRKIRRPTDFFDRRAPKARNYADHIGSKPTTFDFF